MRRKLFFVIGFLLILAATLYGILLIQTLPATDSQAKEVFSKYLENEYQIKYTKTYSHTLKSNCKGIEAVIDTEQPDLLFSSITKRLSHDGWNVEIFGTNYNDTQATVTRAYFNPLKSDLSGNITYDLNKVSFRITKNYKDCY